MISWQKTDYGFRVTFSNPITIDEAERWRDQVKEAILNLNTDFYGFVDLRNCELMPNECKPIIEQVQTLVRENGLRRSVVILSDKITSMQFQLIAKKTGIYEWERYIDASMNPDWEKVGMNWLLHAIDPDINVKSPTPIAGGSSL